MKPKTSPTPPRDVVTLADLVPKHRVMGGSERRVFGADPVVQTERAMSSKKATSDLQNRATSVKGAKKAL
jgi:hypothetical protein